MDLSFPTQIYLKGEVYDKFIECNQLLVKHKFEDALKIAEELQLKQNKEEIKDESLEDKIDAVKEDDHNDGVLGQREIVSKFILKYLKVKVLKHQTNYLEAVKEADLILNDLERIVQDQKNSQSQEQNQLSMNHLYLKTKYCQAKCLNKVAEYTKAEFACDQIEQFETKYDEKNESGEYLVQAQKYWKYVVKAQYIKARQMELMMEFESAKKYLEEHAKPVLKRIIDQFQEDKSQSQTKDLIDNKYSFQYRKQYTRYLRKFRCINQCNDILKNILSDELEYYGLKNLENYTTDQLNQYVQEYQQSQQNLAKHKSLPLLKIAQTYIELGKNYKYSRKQEESFRSFDNAAKLIKAAFDGSENTLKQSKIFSKKGMTILKCNSSTNFEDKDVKDAIQKFDIATEILQKIFINTKFEQRNFILAKLNLKKGDVFLEGQKKEEAEKYYLVAQNMTGFLYTENHPAILIPNSKLQSYYGESEKEEELLKCNQISLKNIEISTKAFGDDSIYTLKAHYDYLSNKILQRNLDEAQPSILKCRQIVQRHHNDDPRNLMNQYFFMTQILVAINLMGTPQEEAAQRILHYVFSQQLRYVEQDSSHPFLEQVVLNLAIYYRTSQQYDSALVMFLQLKRIQETAFGPESESVIYTLKNLGVCYLATGESEQSEKYYIKAKEIIEKLNLIRKPSENQSQQEKEDNQQLAAMYFNLYLAAVQREDYQKASEYNLKCLNYHVLVSGSDQTISCTNCYFIESQMEFRQHNFDKSIEYIQKALSIFELQDRSELGRRPDELHLIQIRYLIAAANIYYVKRDYKNAHNMALKARNISNDGSLFTFETITDAKKHAIEAQRLVLKSEAQLQGKSSLDMKPIEEILRRNQLQYSIGEQEEEKIKEQQQQKLKELQNASYMRSAFAAFGLVSSTSFLLSYMLLKNRQ
ncbi:tetratricopeptide repeat family [Stylonychia lemnae]|uniref:Tetratricopeptide repeat family n=1 Tax=Stylonychia lemnae TaxID=5949 RepID=A0A078A9M4_STYLE|nr:tetratricopeptide repeat family [Stylonychia lemnae]|eukprot:CDW78879.1 tetratricopeptide repeat family [Stylonychia lemnae]